MSRKVWGFPVLLLMLVAGMMLAGCSGSSDGDTTTKIQGSVVDAPIVGAIVNVYSSNGGKLGSTKTGLGGAYTLHVSGGKAPFLVEYTNDNGAAFLAKTGTDTQTSDDPNWNVPAFYTYVLTKGGAQDASGSVISTFAAELAIALHGGTVGQTKANVEKARNMVQGLFTKILAANAMEVSDSFDVLGTAAAATMDADSASISDSFAMRVLQRAVVKMAQGATNNAILPADIDDALNSGEALINAIKLLAADLADSVLDGTALPGAMDDLSIPDNFRAAFAAAAPTPGDYAAWGSFNDADVLVTLGQMVDETPLSFKAADFDTSLADASRNAGNGIALASLPRPPANMRVNAFPNRVVEGATGTVTLEVVLLDGCDTPIDNIDQTVNLSYDKGAGSGNFVESGDVTTGYDLSLDDTAASGNKVALNVKLRANSKLAIENQVKVLSDTAANRAKAQGYTFSFMPCSIETNSFDNCTTVSLVFDITDLDSNPLDNQSITLTLADNAVFSDGKTSQTIKVNALTPFDVDICPFDNLLAGCSVLFDSTLASDAAVMYSMPIRVVDSAAQPWTANIVINSPATLNASGDTTVDLSISLLDSCGNPYTGSASVFLSVTNGTVVPGTLSAMSANSKALNVTVNGGSASGTVIYTAPSTAAGFDTFSIETGISEDVAAIPFP